MDIIEALKKAIEDEMKSAGLYRQCAEEAGDPEGRALFETLAGDEERHLKVLKERLMAIKLRKERGQ